MGKRRRRLLLGKVRTSWAWHSARFLDCLLCHVLSGTLHCWMMVSTQSKCELRVATLRLTLGRPGSPRNLLSHLFFSLRKTKDQSSSALRVAVRSAWQSLPLLARSTLGQRQLQKCSWNLCLHVRVLVGGWPKYGREPFVCAYAHLSCTWSVCPIEFWEIPHGINQVDSDVNSEKGASIKVNSGWVLITIDIRHGCCKNCSTFSYYTLQWKSWFKARSSSGRRETSNSHKEVLSMNNNIKNILTIYQE